MADKVVVIRTSDRSTFKRCRRKWGFSSHLRNNLEPVDRPSYFWLGSGGHFALEDYHGHNYYKHPSEAFKAYVTAWKKWCRKSRHNLPDDIAEQTELGIGILDYYLTWLNHRDSLKTLWVDGKPQVEIKCRLTLPIDPPKGFDRVVYDATLDRIVVIDSELWILDYKFYKKVWNANLDFDAQMSAYIWAASTIYEKPIKGAILMMFMKKLAEAPRVLATGKISSDKKQSTTYHMYKQALKELYGSPDRAPMANISCLNDLNAQESEERDPYIIRSYTQRNQAQIEACGTCILDEVNDMLNPNLPLYPNQTKDCSWECDMNDICVMMDRDDDWHDLLTETTIDRVEEKDSWRKHLK